MKVKLVAYGIAKDILGNSKLELELEHSYSIQSLKTMLVQGYPAFTKLNNLRFAVNEEYQNDDYILEPNDEVVIIPPVSGG
ncbi:MAG: MoaD/ThiS family protein [Bacteroidia bacterium]